MLISPRNFRGVKWGPYWKTRRGPPWMTLSEMTWAMKKKTWLFRILGILLASYLWDWIINHEMRIPIKPPGFNGETKEPRCFLRGSLAKNPTGLPDMNFRHVFERIFVPQFVGSILVPSCQPFAACGTKKKTAEKVKMIGRMRSGIGSLRRIEKKNEIRGMLELS